MKKLLLSLLACGAIAAANAQAGSILVYGNAGIHASKEAAAKPNTTLNFNITPGVGYQFNKNWTAGLYGDYSMESTKPDGGKRSGDRSYGVGLFGRYTCPISPIFSVFGQVNAGYVAGHTFVNEKKVNASEFNGFEANFTPAVQVYVVNGFALNFGIGGIGFNSSKLKDADHSATSLDITFGQQFNFGISKNFGCSHHKAKKGKHGMMDDTRRMDSRDDDEEEAPKKKKSRRDDDDE